MQAYGDNLIVKEVEDNESEIIRPDGKHQWAVEVLSVGHRVNKGVRDSRYILEEGDFLMINGELTGYNVDDQTVGVIHSAQVKGIVSEEEL